MALLTEDVVTTSGSNLLHAKSDQNDERESKHSSPEPTKQTSGTCSTSNSCTNSPHIYFLIDTTKSMRSYLNSLNQVLDQLFGMVSILFAGQAQIHIISFQDYCQDTVISECHDMSQIRHFARTQLILRNGGDRDEAAKTALNTLYRHMFNEKKEEKQCLVFVYTDAAPHHKHSRSRPALLEAEALALQGLEPGFDWVRICAAFAAHGVPFYTFLSCNVSDKYALFWKMLGHVIELPDTATRTITQATIGCLCQILGCTDQSEYASFAHLRVLAYERDQLNALVRDANELIKNGDELHCKGLLPRDASEGPCERLVRKGFVGLEKVGFVGDVLQNLPWRLLKDEAFRDVVFGVFESVFTLENVVSLSYNSVFGKIWRHLCRFREDPRLGQLTDKFGNLMSKLEEPDKSVMQAWLEESYDSTDHINQIISAHIRKKREQSQKLASLAAHDANDANSANIGQNGQTAQNAQIAAKGDDADKSGANGKDAKDGQKVEMMDYIVLDAIGSNALPNKKELLSISHSLFGDIIQKVQQVMTHLIIVSTPLFDPPPMASDATKQKTSHMDEMDEKQQDALGINAMDRSDMVFVGVPVSLDNVHFFALLSHLVVPGTMFTLRPSLIMAMIAYLSGNVTLRERCKQFLIEKRGTWILLDKLSDYPEFASVPFVKLVLRCHQELMSAHASALLTPAEQFFYSNLHKLYRLRQARPKAFELQVPYEPPNVGVRPDYKRKCRACGQFRSFTLLLDNGMCPLCWYACTPGDAHFVAPEQVGLQDVAAFSHIVSCRSCSAIYAVIRNELLCAKGRKPLCHYCRYSEPKSDYTLSCVMCRRAWVCPDKSVFDESKAWVCPCCARDRKIDLGRKMEVSKFDVTFGEIARCFPELLSGLFGVKLGADACEQQVVLRDILGSMSLYKLWVKYGKELIVEQELGDEKQMELEPDPVAKVVNEMQRCGAMYRGMRIINLKEIVRNVLETVKFGKLDDMCCLCFDTKQLVQLESACGMCANLVCAECLRMWYGQVCPGKIVLPTHLLCPLCKQRPRVATMKKYNKKVCEIVRENRDVVARLSLSLKHYYGWCVRCFRVKQALPRECMRGNLPDLDGFVCESCNEMETGREVMKKFKKCPGCSTPTVKVDGCNHITCVCGVHWCYQCGLQFGSDEIYDHMYDTHGDIYTYEVE